MTAFESAWIFLKNAPVPTYAQPKIRYDGSQPDEGTGLPRTQPPPRSAMEDKRDKEVHNRRHREGYHGYPNRYGHVEIMPRPEVGSGESSFDSERMNTGTSVFNPIPSWQDMGQQANAANDSMQTFGTAQPPAVAQPPVMPPMSVAQQQERYPQNRTGINPSRRGNNDLQYY